MSARCRLVNAAATADMYACAVYSRSSLNRRIADQLRTYFTEEVVDVFCLKYTCGTDSDSSKERDILQHFLVWIDAGLDSN